MFKRYAGSGLVVVLLTLLVSMAATADYGPNGTAGSTVGTTDDMREPGEKTKKLLPEPVRGVYESGSARKISLSDKSLELQLPANLSDENLELFIDPEEAPGNRGGTSLFRIWDLRAESLTRKTEVSSFDAELTLTVEFQLDEIPGMDWRSLTFVWFNPESETWELIPTDIDIESLTMTAKTDHFSIFGAQAASAYAVPGQIMDYQVNLNSGAATYSYPLQLPPGRGGFQPLSLSFNYNSGSVDEMKNKRDIGSMAGVGWSFDLPHVLHNEESGAFSLVLDGVSGELLPDEFGSRYHVNPDSGVYVDYLTAGSGHKYWKVINRSGVVYLFENRRNRFRSVCDDNWVYRWDLTEVTDPHGNAFEITWQNDTQEDSGSCDSVRASYPQLIKAMDGVSSHIWQVDFDYESTATSNFADSVYSGSVTRIRQDVPGDRTSYPEPIVAETQILDLVSIEDSSGNVIRQYDLTTDTTESTDSGYGFDSAGEHTLESIAQKGVDGGAIPATSFEYSSKEVYFRNVTQGTDNGNPGNPVAVNRSYLDYIENGFGARITFEYEQRPDNEAQSRWSRQIVKKVTADPDLSSAVDGVPIVTTYEYLNSSGNPGQPVYIAADWSGNDYLYHSVYLGYSTVKVTAADGTYSLNYFFVGPGSVSVDPIIGDPVSKDSSKFKGKLYAQERYSADGTLLTRSYTDWTWTWIDSIRGTYQTNVAGRGDEVFDANGADVESRTWTYFTHDEYGNVTVEGKLGDYDTAEDDVTIHTDYNVNTSSSVWIVNTPLNRRVYAGDHPTDPGSNKQYLKGETRYLYDGSGYDVDPTKGNPTEVQRYVGLNESLSTSHTYDGTYGTRTSSTDPRGETTSFTYDSILHAYKVTTTLPQVGTDTAMTVQAGYDTVADGGHPAGILRGLVESQTDENGNETSNVYDEFGRIQMTVRPGDSCGTPSTCDDPSFRFTYDSWGTPGQQRIKTEVKIDASPEYAVRNEFFDGFGRVLQAHEAAPNGSDTLVMGSVQHDANGRVIDSYTPWVVSGTPTTYQSPLAGVSTSNSEKSAGQGASISAGANAWVSSGSITSSDDTRSANSGPGLSSADTGWLAGTSALTSDWGAHWPNNNPWQSPLGGLAAGDQQWASAYVDDLSGVNESDWLLAKFENADVPSDATITGYEGQWRHRYQDYAAPVNPTGSPSLDVNNPAVQFFDGITKTGNEKTANGSYGQSWTTGTAGGDSDLWGTSLSISDFQSGDARLGYEADNVDPDDLIQFDVDSVELKIHFEEPTQSDYIEATGFGFDVPAGSRIDGIEVKIERSAESASPVIRDHVVQLLRDGVAIGENKADTASPWPTTDTVKSYGGSSDTWDRSWTTAEINDADFGVRLQVRTESMDNARVDHVQIKVYYRTPDPDDTFASSTVYDALGRVISQTGVDGSTVTHSYAAAAGDGEVWAGTITDPEGNVRKNYTDAFGRLVRIEELNDSAQVYRETNYTYDRLGNLTKVVVDPIIESSLPNVVTEMTYDWLGRKVTHRDPDIGFWQYTYDGNGNLATQTDARGVEITFTYDELNRETKRECTANCIEGSLDITLAMFDYDDDSADNNGLGRRTWACSGDGCDDDPIDGDVVDSYYYDHHGRLTQQTRLIQGDPYVTTYEYDTADRIVSTTHPNGERVEQNYNNRSLAESVFSSTLGEVVESTTHNVLNLQTAVQLGNGIMNEREYYGLEHQPANPADFGRLYSINTSGFTGQTWDIMYANVVQTFQPSGYWRLNESSGTTASDSSSTGNDGTYQGSPTLDAEGLLTGDSDAGVEFDSTSEHVELSSAIDLSSTFTIAALANWNGSDNTEWNTIFFNDQVRFRRNPDSSGGGWSARVQKSDSSWMQVNSDDEALAGQTYHVAVSWDGTTLKLYVDGELQADTVTPGTGLYATPGTTSIGGEGASATNFNGTLDEVAYFEVALSQSEIRLLTDAARKLPLSLGYDQLALMHDPVGYWRLNESSGTTASDTSSAGNHGTYQGSPTLGVTGLIIGDSDEAAVFDATAEYVELGSSTDLSASPFTIAALASWDGSDSTEWNTIFYNDQIRLRRDPDSSGGGWSARVRKSDSNWMEIDGDELVVADQTYHVAVTWDGTNLKLFVNGVEQADTETPGTGIYTTPGTSSIGGSGDSVINFNGTIDEVAYFDEALPTLELTALTDAAAGGNVQLRHDMVTAGYVPLGYWRLNESSGTTASDSSSTGNDGTYQGSPTLDAAGLLIGDSDAGVEFDSTSEHVELSSAIDLSSTSFTIAALANWDGSDNTEWNTIFFNDQVRFRRNPDSSGGGWSARVQKSDSSWMQVNSDDEALAGQTYHVAVSWDGTTLKLYVDGELQADTETPGTGLYATPGTTSIGGEGASATNFNGTLDEVAYFDVALFSADIATLNLSSKNKPYTWLPDITFTWDDNGNLTSRTDDLPGQATQVTESFSYDFLDRLTGASNAYTRDYTYDGHDNITSKTGQGDYTYDYTAPTPPGETDPRVDLTSGGEDHYWPFNSDTISGNYVEDLIGDDDGTFGTNAPAVVSGLFDEALDFSSDNLELPIDVLDGKADLTFSFWIKPDDTEDQPAILSGWNYLGQSEICIFLNSGNEIGFMPSHTYGGTTVYWSDLPDLYDGNWHHVSVIREGSSNRAILYVDGVNFGPINRTMNDLDVEKNATYAAGVQLGYPVCSGTEAYLGLIDEFRIYDRVLDEPEVTALYYTGTSPARAHLVTGTDTSGADAYEYDENGNTTVRPDQTLFWNSLNLLKEIKNASATATIESYLYDADGQRTVKTAADGTKTHYVSGSFHIEIPTSGYSTTTVTYMHGGQLVATQSSTPVDPDTTPSHIYPTGIAAGDEIHAVAIDGDTLVVLAPKDDYTYNDEGIAYVYVNDGTGDWILQATLETDDGEASDLLGEGYGTVAIDGDTIAIGAYNEDGAGANRGAVYVFTRSGSSWSQQQKVTAPSPLGYEYFGQYVDLEGDRLVATTTHGNGGKGKVYVYTRSGSTWSIEQQITASDGGAAGDNFGWAAALEGDTLVIGAGAAYSGAYAQGGKVYIYQLVDGTWTFEEMLYASDPEGTAWFGSTVEFSGGTVVVGARRDDEEGADSGAIYVFRRDGSGSWEEVQKLTGSTTAAGDYFGSSISVDGDMIIAGGDYNDGVGGDSGSAYVFRWVGGEWVEHAALTGDSEAAGDRFGYSVAIDGEYIVVGVRMRHNGGDADTGSFIVEKVREQSVQFMHTDHLGSPVATTDAFGELLGSQSFYPFGEVRGSSGVFDTSRGFTGQIHDSGTGLSFYNARYYDSALGKFVSPDSFVLDATLPDLFNRFAYVSNNPLRFTDPSGFCRYDENGDFVYATDCTFDEFNALEWEDRIRWFELLEQDADVENWFAAFRGVLESLKDANFSETDWLNAADAGALVAIQDGLRLFRGESAIEGGVYSVFNEGAEGWRNFFQGVYDKLDDQTLIERWAIAEQAGVDAGLIIADGLFGLMSAAQQSEANRILRKADEFRSAMLNHKKILPGGCWDWKQRCRAPDPRNWGFAEKTFINIQQAITIWSEGQRYPY